MKHATLLAATAVFFALAAAPVAQAQMNMSLFKDDTATAAPAPTPASTTTPVMTPAAPPAPAAAVVAAAPAGAPVAAQTPASVPADATASIPAAAAAPVATPADVAAQPSCPAGKTNPASDQATRPDLPSSLQKLYALRLPSFTAADLNCDGLLDGSEIKAMVDKKFVAADTNRDGVISEAEAQGVVGDFEETAASNGSNVIVAPRATTLKHRLAAMDADQDGLITRPEFEAYYQARYQKLDRNGDGKLDITEYQTDDEDNRRVRAP